jgi:hypothetical protein
MEMEIVMELTGNLGELITPAGSNKLDAELMEMLDRYHFILEAEVRALQQAVASAHITNAFTFTFQGEAHSRSRSQSRGR